MSTTGIRQAIDKLSAEISADASKAKAKPVPATARLIDGLRCEVTGPRGERVATDMPPAMGGAASAPNPGWYLRGAMASCTATGLDEKISAAPALSMKVKIRGDPDAETLRELVAWGVAHSPVGCTVSAGPPCAVEIELV